MQDKIINQVVAMVVAGVIVNLIMTNINNGSIEK